MQYIEIEKFERELNKIITELQSDDETAPFATYFINEYYMKTKLWAYCHRMHLGINTNMHLERMHGIIKGLYFKGKVSIKIA